jgi:cytochrome c oxidase subunit 5a
VARYSHKAEETDEEFDKRYEQFFNRPDIDGWEVRKAINDLQGFDLVPEPKIVIAAMRACRRINDFALTVRFLEALKVSLLFCYVL